MTIENPIKTRLIQYIDDLGLHDEQPLPEESELLEILHCDVEELNVALADMATHKLIKRSPWGWWAVPRPSLDKEDEFSLSETAWQRGHGLETRVTEKAVRLPLDNFEQLTHIEKRAQESLGLSPDQPFIVLVRIRTLTDSPADAPKMAIHRVYLRPDRFPADFLEKHDFAKESLIHLYRQYGYAPQTRDTRLQARQANGYERDIFHTPVYQPILHVEQELYARDPGGEEIMLESLQASYLNWIYEVKGRPA